MTIVAAVEAAIERIQTANDRLKGIREISANRSLLMDAQSALHGTWQDFGGYSTKVAAILADYKARGERIAKLEEHDRFGWRGLQNLYSIITGQECEITVALGMATSAVDRLQREHKALIATATAIEQERDAYSSNIADIFYALNPHKRGLEGQTIAPSTLASHVEHLRQERDAALEDTRRLDAMIEYGWAIEKITADWWVLSRPNGNGSRLGVGSGSDPREAIDAAAKEKG